MTSTKGAFLLVKHLSYIRPTKWRQNGANSQILICKGVCFRGNKEDTLNAKVTDKDKIQFNQAMNHTFYRFNG